MTLKRRRGQNERFSIPLFTILLTHNSQIISFFHHFISVVIKKYELEKEIKYNFIMP